MSCLSAPQFGPKQEKHKQYKTILYFLLWTSFFCNTALILSFFHPISIKWKLLNKQSIHHLFFHRETLFSLFNRLDLKTQPMIMLFNNVTCWNESVKRIIWTNFPSPTTCVALVQWNTKAKSAHTYPWSSLYLRKIHICGFLQCGDYLAKVIIYPLHYLYAPIKLSSLCLYLSHLSIGYMIKVTLEKWTVWSGMKHSSLLFLTRADIVVNILSLKRLLRVENLPLCRAAHLTDTSDR